MSDYTLSYITPAGISYPLNDNVHVWLRENGMRGFGVIRVEAATERLPYHQGVSVLGGPYTGERDMEVAFDIIHSSLADWVTLNRSLSRNASAYIDTDALGTLHLITPDGLSRDIDCWLVEWTEGNRNGPSYAAAVSAFWAPLPWFYDPAQQVSSFALTSPGGITYPADYDVATGIPYATVDINVHLSPNNLGDVESWPVIRIYGPGAHPTIENETTAKTIASTQHMDANDYITINMQAATITWWDNSAGTTTSIIQTLTDASEFWPLIRGENVLHITMASASTGNVQVTWYNYYQSA